eukprot:CCRYP_003114-RA/>CCRYP_003114-RA protein AED:0.00 eAED:0.00 QI:171/1/1/1/0/0/2/121/401
MMHQKKSSTDSKDKSTTKPRTSSNQETSDDDHSASSISNDTFASRSYLRNSLASDPWNSASPSKPQNECESPHDQTPSLPPMHSNRKSHRPCSKNTSRKSRPDWHASYVDLPQVRESMIASISKDVVGMMESDEDSNECLQQQHPRHTEKCVNKQTEPRGNRHQKLRNHSTTKPAKTKTNNILPSTQLLSSLGLDSSSREQEERNNTRPSSLLGALWDQSAPTNNPIIDHYDDENICESGAMALVRCMNGDVRFTEGGQISNHRPCYCIFKTMNLRLFLRCVIILLIIVSLAVAIPVSLWRYGASRVENDQNANTTILSGEFPISTSTIDANGGMSESDKLPLAEEIIRVCRPNGYDEDIETCRKHCHSKECCFMDLDDEQGGNVVGISGITLTSFNKNAA